MSPSIQTSHCYPLWSWGLTMGDVAARFHMRSRSNRQTDSNIHFDRNFMIVFNFIASSIWRFSSQGYWTVEYFVKRKKNVCDFASSFLFCSFLFGIPILLSAHVRYNVCKSVRIRQKCGSLFIDGIAICQDLKRLLNKYPTEWDHLRFRARPMDAWWDTNNVAIINFW